MKFEVYCDESRPDLLSSNRASARFMIIGSLWLESKDRSRFKRDVQQFRDRHRVGGEFKWQKISPSRVDFYRDIVAWFNAMGNSLRFRGIAVDQNQVNLKLYHEGDQELGFYKFYYQLLHHWIQDFNKYAIFVDYKKNRRRDRLALLQRCLDLANLSSRVCRVQAIRSEESVLIQLADVLTGAVSYRLNDKINANSCKFRVLEHLENMAGRRIVPTNKGEQKLNVFQIDLTGGW